MYICTDLEVPLAILHKRPQTRPLIKSGSFTDVVNMGIYLLECTELLTLKLLTKVIMHTSEETQHNNIHSIYIHKNTQVFNILQCQTLKGKKITM